MSYKSNFLMKAEAYEGAYSQLTQEKKKIVY